jgi:TolB protein
MRTSFTPIIVILLIILTAGTGLAQRMAIDIHGPGQKKINIYLSKPTAFSGEAATAPWSGIPELTTNYLSFLPFLAMVPARNILGGSEPGGHQAAQIDFRKYSLSQVDLLMTSAYEQRTGAQGRLELRVYEIFTQRLVLGRAYMVEHDGQLESAVRRFCSELMEALAGNGDFFRSKLAFVRKEGNNKEIWSVTPFGTGLKQLTFLSGLNLSPAWSPDGKSLIFTHVDGGGHRLGHLDVASGSATLHRVPGNSCISPVYTPSGEVAVSLAFKGNPDIYLLDGQNKVRSALAENWAIDISPSFDAKGEKMAFVSGRFGNPHIFLLVRATGEVRRITFEGKYNTSPSMSPDGRRIAFTRMLPEGHRIFLMEVATGRETQITFGPGNDESPAFATDGYFLAFSSSRSGANRIYITNRFGEDPKMVQTGSGEVTSPAWVVEP